jgi:hypothetical protein
MKNFVPRGQSHKEIWITLDEKNARHGKSFPDIKISDVLQIYD